MILIGYSLVLGKNREDIAIDNGKGRRRSRFSNSNALSFQL